MCKNAKEQIIEFKEMTGKDLIKDLPKRFISLIHKLIGIKGVCLGLATWLLLIGTLESWAWMMVVLIIIFGREALKFVADIRG